MPPRVQALEAFVRLFADDSELRKSFGALEGTARKAGTAAAIQRGPQRLDRPDCGHAGARGPGRELRPEVV
jgi:hypothetical protein